jgi:hypothetical protein
VSGESSALMPSEPRRLPMFLSLSTIPTHECTPAPIRWGLRCGASRRVAVGSAVGGRLEGRARVSISRWTAVRNDKLEGTRLRIVERVHGPYFSALENADVYIATGTPIGSGACR